MNFTVVEERTNNIAVLDVYSKMAQDRIIWIRGEIDERLANGIMSQLMYLDSLNNDEITIYINSPGGYVYQGFGIIDVMRIVKSPIKTIVVGQAMSMAAAIAVCGDTRMATKHSTFMFHQPSGGTWGKSSDMEVTLEEIVRIRAILYDIILEKTQIGPYSGDKHVTEIFKDDWYVDATTAYELNVIDEIL